ncbi:MAG: metallophosphoesterase [Anaerolineae bacterium]|nr:MAG: metallophosphoesterase [Anaerolineae bacterium]
MTHGIEIGVISDTHGRLSLTAREALAGVSLILHAGDVDRPEILTELAKVAPVHAVRGNMDRLPGVAELPRSRVVEVGEVLLFMLHDLLDLDLNPAAAGFRAVITGHTHRPEVSQRGSVLFLNPGSASHPRGVPRPTVARMMLNGAVLTARLVELPLDSD